MGTALHFADDTVHTLALQGFQIYIQCLPSSLSQDGGANLQHIKVKNPNGPHNVDGKAPAIAHFF